MVFDPRRRVTMTVEQSPWQTFFASLPNTILAYMQLNMQLEQQQITREYQATREDLRFARQDYLQVKKREEDWRDTISKAGYSLENITKPGSGFIQETTQGYSEKASELERSITELRSLSTELGQWAKKGVAWEKEFASFEDKTRENEYRNLVLEGGAFLYNEKDKAEGKIPEGKKVGDVYGTGEFAEALKSLSSIEIEKLKDINVRTAVSADLRSEATAIKDWSALMAGQKIASEIGQKQSGVMWQNIIRTADKYSGRENITAIQTSMMQYAMKGGGNEYQDVSGNLTLEGQNLELQKAAIGREYEYLVMGNYMDLPEDATEEQIIAQQRRQISSYNTMASDFDVAKPTAGGYGRQGAPGNQIRLRETIASAYQNFQNIVAGGDMDEANKFSSKALKYLGVNFSDPAIIEQLDLQSTLDRNEVTDEILSSLDYVKGLEEGTIGPYFPELEPELGPPISEGTLPVPDEADPSYYQQGKDYYDKATEAVWGPQVAEAIKSIPLYKAGRATTSGLVTGARVGTDLFNQALFDVGAVTYNLAGVPLNQLTKFVTGYSPGLSGERTMESLLGWSGAGPRSDPGYSFGTATPEGGFWTEDMKNALRQLDSSDKQLSSPKPDFKYISQKRRKAEAKAVSDSLAVIDQQSSPIAALSEIFLNSRYLKSLGSFADILDEWKLHVAEEKQFGRSPDLGEWLIDTFPEIESDLIR